MPKNTLKAANDTYRGIKINRHNANYYKCEIKVKYSIVHNGINIYFETQDAVKAFIDDMIARGVYSKQD